MANDRSDDTIDQGPRADDASSEVAKLLAPMRLAGPDRFRPAAALGHGGAGVVRAVDDAMLRRRVAAKSMRTEAASKPIEVRAFVREVQITAQLDHPNIVPIYDAGVGDDGLPVFMMKLVEGRSLASMLDAIHVNELAAEPAREHLAAMIELVVKVCDAVSFAHERGVVHNDLKPENVMVGTHGETFVTDWGLAVVKPATGTSGDAARTGRCQADPFPVRADRGRYAFGTAGYMAPEQASGEFNRVEERTDVFLLGALLYRIITGAPPFFAADQEAAWRRARAFDVVPLERNRLRAMCPRPDELVRIVHRAMARRPEDRYASVAALQADLQAFLRGGSTLPIRRFAAGTEIVTEGDVAEAAYLLMRGEAEVVRKIDGNRVVLATLRAGDTFGELAHLTHGTRSASVVARSEVEAVEVTRERFDEELDAMKPWMSVFMRSFAARFVEHEKRAFEAPARDDRGRGGRWKLW